MVRQAGFDIAKTGLFCLAIYLPLLVLVFTGPTAVSVAEQRRLAQWPGIPETIAAWQALPDKISNFVADQFGFRRLMVTHYNRLLHRLGRENPRALVVRGKNGWLFYAGDGVLEDVRGTLRFTHAELKAWAAALTHRHRTLRQRGIAYLFVLAPNKHSIYPEYLPDWLQPGHAGTRTDQWVAFMRSRTSVPIVDLRGVLAAQKSLGPLYRKYDTHWNAIGAHLAQTAIVASLSLQVPVPAAESVTADSFRWQPRKGGDLARLLGAGDLVENLPVSDGHRSQCHWGKKRNEKSGQPENRIRVDYCAKNRLTAWVFHDSFMNQVRWFLSPYFSVTRYVRNAAGDCSLVTQAVAAGADIVIEQRVERFLSVVVPTDC